MRLKSIRLAGFKSFVEPTTVSFPGNLCAVVGPNGCGKSNVIDAVRWVMGESSASKLRSDAITDVIFSGSSQRKPTTQASVELTFDNTDGRIGGEYATYGEIMIRRQLARDGQSSWYLNGTRCRRRDILGVFLGTGFGPRSYSIIEQGMVSQLIEARPEDLRLFLEEAASISKYRERRRETGNRIAHTRENLERLGDLRTELERQLQSLKRQVRAAERYRGLKDQEKETRGQLMTLRWQKITTAIDAAEDERRRLDTAVEAEVTGQRRAAAEAEELRVARTTASDQVDDIQGRFHEVGARIARLEESIHNRNNQRQRLGEDLSNLASQQSRLASQAEEDQQVRSQAEAEIIRLEPLVGSLRDRAAAVETELATAEDGMRAWQERWDAVTGDLASARQQLEVARGRGEYLERNIARATERIGQLEGQRGDQETEGLARGVEALREAVDADDTQVGSLRMALEAALEERNRLREELTAAGAALDTARDAQQNLAQDHAALSAAQRLALGEAEDEDRDWLQRHGLADAPRVGASLDVDKQWEQAVEHVLGPWLKALGADLPAAADNIEGRLWMVGPAGTATDPAAGALSGHVRATVDVVELLRGVRTVADMDEALSRRQQLAPGESFVTADGDQVGRSWLRRGGLAAEQTGVLARGRRIDEISQELADAGATVTSTAVRVEEARKQGAAAGERRDLLQRQLAETSDAASERRGELGQRQVRLEEARARRQRADAEYEELSVQLALDQQALATARAQGEEAAGHLTVAENAAAGLRDERSNWEAAVSQARDERARVQGQLEQERMGQERHRARIQSLEVSHERLRTQLEDGGVRDRRLREELEGLLAPAEQDQRQLDEDLSKRATIEEELRTARVALEALDGRAGELEEFRARAEEAVTAAREQLSRHQLDLRELEVRRSNELTQLKELGADPAEVAETLPEGASEERWVESLEQVAGRITRLGAINLAAIDEFQSQQERKTYLDAQNEDLEKALATLESAILRIDRETRDRFSETFDKVNRKFRELFPKVFGGGDAYLELIGDDPLTAGVRVMARPPGKRNTSIHLLSGGEKALVALALVFSIFDLNPSPVCMLDEVDAPLDDVNVGRFADLIREMSGEVQFVYVTHNKLSMEMADQLCGVTMQEPGVSRLVMVDIEEAEALAAV